MDVSMVLPELLLLAGALAMLMVGVFGGNKRTPLLVYAGAGLMAVAALVILLSSTATAIGFSGMFRVNSFTQFMKILVLLGSAGALLISLRYIKRVEIDRFEYPVLFVLATAGMMMMISADDLISVYIGLELQSLALYIVAAFRRDTVTSSEAGLKYFVLGALSSGMLLFGMSLVYGFLGATGFPAIASQLAAAPAGNIGLIVGLSFVAAGLAFKISAVPFHMWTPDVYQGAPLPVTAFFATAPKVAAMALIVRVMMEPFGPVVDQWQQIIIAISVLSMLLGAFVALYQTNIKRLLAYSSIGNIGYALVGLAAGTEAGVRGVVIYITIYLLMNLGLFACLLALKRDGRVLSKLSHFAGLGKSHGFIAGAMVVFLFSMAGIPPLAGFWGKFYVFVAAVEAGLIWLAVLGVLSSVISAFYYIRIIKLMYFDEGDEDIQRVNGPELTGVIVVCLAAMFALFLFISPLERIASAAAASLF